MSKQYIKTPTGKLMGYVDDSGSIYKAYTFNGFLLGTYDKNKNMTFTASGKLLAEGNVLAVLIWDPKLIR